MKISTPPSVQSLDHVHVFVSNRDSSERWYNEVLGFQRIKEFAFWATEGGPLTIQNAAGTVHIALFERPTEKCRSTIALGVDANEFLAWRTHLRAALGQSPKLADHKIAWSLYFHDPDENPYEITTYAYQEVKVELAESKI